MAGEQVDQKPQGADRDDRLPSHGPLGDFRVDGKTLFRPAGAVVAQHDGLGREHLLDRRDYRLLLPLHARQ